MRVVFVIYYKCKKEFCISSLWRCGDNTMDKFTYELLSILKSRLNKSKERYQVLEMRDHVFARQFYFNDLNDNLAEPMLEKSKKEYRNGSGNELDDKMKAVRSSSAMTYNIFRNADVTLAGITYDVTYEKQLYTLKRNVSGNPANLDAFLLSKDENECIACEMKMTEWIFNKPSKLKEAYLKKESYQVEESAAIFIGVAENLIASMNDYDTSVTARKEYECYLCQYDAFQMFKHTLALYNGCVNGAVKAEKLTLANVVWEVPFASELSSLSLKKYETKLENEHREFQVFYEAMQPIKKTFKELGVEFEISYCSINDFIRKMELNDEVKHYLERYTK